MLRNIVALFSLRELLSTHRRLFTSLLCFRRWLFQRHKSSVLQNDIEWENGTDTRTTAKHEFHHRTESLVNFSSQQPKSSVVWRRRPKTFLSDRRGQSNKENPLRYSFCPHSRIPSLLAARLRLRAPPVRSRLSCFVSGNEFARYRLVTATKLSTHVHVLLWLSSSSFFPPSQTMGRAVGGKILRDRTTTSFPYFGRFRNQQRRFNPGFSEEVELRLCTFAAVGR